MLSLLKATFGHTAWGLCIGWIVIACFYGYGGPINAILSYKGLLPLSRLTFCAYLIHPVIMVITSFQLDGPYHLHNAVVVSIIVLSSLKYKQFFFSDNHIFGKYCCVIFCCSIFISNV